MSHATRIIDGKLGGTRKAAALLGLPTSTVQSWKDSGYIPAKQQQPVLDAARANGMALGPEDFFDRPGEASEAESPPDEAAA